MSVNDFIEAGIVMTRHASSSGIIRERRFRQMFGITPFICSMIWEDLRVQQLHLNNAKPVYMLCALLLLRLYETDDVNRAISGIDEKTFRKWAWIYISLIAENILVVRILHYAI